MVHEGPPADMGGADAYIGLDSDPYRRSTFGQWRESARTIEKDVRAVETADLKGFDAIVHVAAQLFLAGHATGSRPFGPETPARVASRMSAASGNRGRKARGAQKSPSSSVARGMLRYARW
jgi:hypothetical protein